MSLCVSFIILHLAYLKEVRCTHIEVVDMSRVVKSYEGETHTVTLHCLTFNLFKRSGACTYGSCQHICGMSGVMQAKDVHGDDTLSHT